MMMEQAADIGRGRRAMEWKRDGRRHQINNQPGRDAAVKAKTVSAVNGTSHCCVDHGGGRKDGGSSRVAVDNR
jgi:hypothetical protein